MPKKSKDKTRLIAAVERAGGTVRRTSRQHLEVRGPDGVAHVGMPNSADPRGMDNVLTNLRRYAGLDVKL